MIMLTEQKRKLEEEQRKERLKKEKKEAIKRAFIEACKIYAERAPEDNLLFMQGFIEGATGKSWQEIEKRCRARK